MTKEEFEKLPEEEQLRLMICDARESYFYLLEGTLNQWAITNKDEKKKMNKLLKAIREYEDYLISVTINK